MSVADGPSHPWLTWARWALWAMAAENLLVGCGLGSLGMLGWNEYFETDGKYPAVFYVLWPLGLLCAGWMPATLQLLAAWGLGRGSRLAWGFSIFVAAVNLLSCNAPLAAVVLYALVGHEETRARFRADPLVVLPLLFPLVAPSPAAAQEPAHDEHPKACDSCEAWNAPHAPFRVAGNTWYVGPDGVSVLAVDTGAGVVLLDGALPQSVPGIVANLSAVGLDVRDVRYILVSHVHYDHVGGVAALQRRTGATVVGTAAAVAALRAGNVPPEDPQAGFGPEVMAFPAVVGPVLALASTPTASAPSALTASATPTIPPAWTGSGPASPPWPPPGATCSSPSTPPPPTGDEWASPGPHPAAVAPIRIAP